MKELIESGRILYLSRHDVMRLGVEDFPAIRRTLKEAYRAKGTGQTVMPKSDYLKYPGRPSYDRIITLLGHLGGSFGVSGVKEICSSTGNDSKGFPRASGLIVLNDPDTQRPFAIMEASEISAARTAGVTSIAIEMAAGDSLQKMAFIGCGALAMRHAKMWDSLYLSKCRAVSLHDCLPGKAAAFAEWLRKETSLEPSLAESAEDAVRNADVVIPMTTSETPYIKSGWMKADSLYAAVSLLDPELELVCDSDAILVDDLPLCLHEGRPLQRLDAAGRLDRSRTMELPEALEKGGLPKGARRIFFNPMGTVITDLALAMMIFRNAIRHGAGTNLNA